MIPVTTVTPKATYRHKLKLTTTVAMATSRSKLFLVQRGQADQSFGPSYKNEQQFGYQVIYRMNSENQKSCFNNLAGFGDVS